MKILLALLMTVFLVGEHTDGNGHFCDYSDGSSIRTISFCKLTLDL